MQACYSVLQQLTARAPPRTLGNRATSVTPEPVHALLTLLQAYQVRQQTWLVTLDFNSGVPGQVKAGAAPFINSAQLSAATQDSATLAAATAATTTLPVSTLIYFSENPPPPAAGGLCSCRREHTTADSTAGLSVCERYRTAARNLQ